MRAVDRKKILILGGTKHFINAVKTAKANRFSPIVADNIIDAQAKALADKYYHINISDTLGLEKIIKEEKVDGILTAFENSNIWHAIALCKKTGLPFYAADGQSALSMNKEKLMEICRSFNISVIAESVVVKDSENVEAAIWSFPILLKPSSKTHEIKRG